jgi:hypothetical protein
MRDLRSIVFENLDSAFENGYFKKGELLHGATLVEIANDMLAYSEDLEDETVDELLPFIREWMLKISGGESAEGLDVES